MASAEQRRPTSQFDQHLNDTRRRALSAGLRWFWVINQLAILYLLARFYLYQDARLVAIDGLPWRYEYQIALVLLASVLPPWAGAGSLAREHRDGSPGSGAAPCYGDWPGR
ncbi:membrane-associated sensor domain-containing protein [Aeromonas rivipollensis]